MDRLPDEHDSTDRRSPTIVDATVELLNELQRIAEATLGHPVHDSIGFRGNCREFGLGEALNIEHDLIDTPPQHADHP